MTEAAPMAVKAEVLEEEEHDPFAFVFQAAPPVGVKSEMGGKPPVPSFPGQGNFGVSIIPSEVVVAEPPAKKRKIKGALEVPQLSKLLQGMHAALQHLTSPPNKPETSVNGLQNQLKRYWKTNFDAKAMGDTSMVGFLRRFPGVFSVKSNGLELVVSAMEAPDFNQEAENGLEPSRGLPEYACKFSSGVSEHVLAFMANLISEEKKVGGHVLNYQFAPFAIYEDFLTRIREDEDALDDQDTLILLDSVCDPRPQPREPVQKDDFDDHHKNRNQGWQDRKDQHWKNDHDWDRGRDRRDDRDGGPRGRGPNFYNRGGDDNYGRDRYRNDRNDDDDRPWRRDNKRDGPGNREYQSDKRGSDGRSLCRQYQFNRCTYGDNCRFLHEFDPERR